MTINMEQFLPNKKERETFKAHTLSELFSVVNNLDEYTRAFGADNYNNSEKQEIIQANKRLNAIVRVF